MTLPDANLYRFFDKLAARWQAMQSPERAVHIAHILTPHTGLFTAAQHIIDIGTGLGAFVPHLRELAPTARITALDLSQVMLQQARTSFPPNNNLSWLRADGQYLPMPPQSADVITCHDSFAHFEHPAAAFAGFHRALRPGGYVLILHDVGRERVNAIHGSASEPRIRTHQLPSITDLAEIAAAAHFTILVTEDMPDHYLLTAQRL